MGVHFLRKMILMNKRIIEKYFRKDTSYKNITNSVSPRLRLHAMFAGTDGQDGPTPSAGVLITYPLDDSNTNNNNNLINILKQTISNHDSHTFFRQHFPEMLLTTGGPTGTNVMDIYCLVAEIIII